MEKEFRKAFAGINKVVEREYGVRAKLEAMRQGFTGDLNGLEIFINESISFEQKLFNLVHLFGHTVQWAVRPDGYELGKQLFEPPLAEELIQRLVEYENEAARYSATLLIKTHNTRFLRWLSDYSDRDVRFLEHWYRTAEKKDLCEFRREGVPKIELLHIPQFMPIKRERRMDGLVVDPPKK